MPSPSPMGRPMNAKSIVVTNIVMVPRPNAYLASERRRSKLSSRPISKSRNSTPSSESFSSSSVLRKRPSWPSTSPEKRKPSTGEALADLKTGTTSTVAARKVRKSRPRGRRTSEGADLQGAGARRRREPASLLLPRRRRLWAPREGSLGRGGGRAAAAA